MSEQEDKKYTDEEEQERQALLAEINSHLDRLAPEEVKLFNQLLSRIKTKDSDTE